MDHFTMNISPVIWKWKINVIFITLGSELLPNQLLLANVKSFLYTVMQTAPNLKMTIMPKVMVKHLKKKELIANVLWVLLTTLVLDLTNAINTIATAIKILWYNLCKKEVILKLENLFATKVTKVKKLMPHQEWQEN